MRATGWVSGTFISSLVSTQVAPALTVLSLNPFQQFELFIRIYGDEFVCVLFSLSLSLFLFYDLSKKQMPPKGIIIIMVSSLLCIAFEFLQDIRPVTGLQIGRYLDFIVALSPIIMAFLLHRIWLDNLSAKKYLRFVGVAFLFCLLFYLSLTGTSGLYRSSSTYLQNLQVTNHAVSGAEWIISNKEESVTIQTITFYYRYLGGIYGYSQSLKLVPQWPGGEKNRPPDHFNYKNSSRLGEFYNEEHYMLITLADIQYYTVVVPMANRYDEDDFERLGCDISITEIYDNGEIWGYLIL